MLAELSNKDIRDFLKVQNLFTKIINAIKKFFGLDNKPKDPKESNTLTELENQLYEIMDYKNPSASKRFKRYFVV